MRYQFISFLLLFHSFMYAQKDSARTVPVPEQIETSYESEEIWFMAIIGLALLITLYFLFRRWRKSTR